MDMRVCPRRHRHTVNEDWVVWCSDCGAIKPSNSVEWQYPQISSLIRGRKGVNLEEQKVYSKSIRTSQDGGDPDSRSNPGLDHYASSSVEATAGT